MSLFALPSGCHMFDGTYGHLLLPTSAGDLKTVLSHQLLSLPQANRTLQPPPPKSNTRDKAGQLR